MKDVRDAGGVIIVGMRGVWRGVKGLIKGGGGGGDGDGECQGCRRREREGKEGGGGIRDKG